MKAILFPNTIDIRVTGKCNLGCPHCFGPPHTEQNVDIENLLELISRFSQMGIKNLVFSGGEPLLLDELPFILKKAKRLGFTVILSTNGKLLESKIHKICPFLDWLGLPLDGDSSIVHSKMRGCTEDHFNTVIHLISSVRKNYPKLPIKIGTVVTKINRSNVLNIPNLLCGILKPDVWKIYQVVYESYGEINKEKVELSDKEFKYIFDKIKLNETMLGFKIVPFFRNERDRKYLFMNPNGDAIVIFKGKEIIIGNFFENLTNVLHKSQYYLDSIQTDNIIRNTYFINNQIV